MPIQAPTVDDGVGNSSNMGSMSLFGLPLSKAQSLEDAFYLVRKLFATRPDRARLVTFVNPYSVRVATCDESYLRNLEKMDLVFCDGIGLAVAARQLHRFPMERVSFDSTSLAPPVFELAAWQKYSTVLLGSKPGVAEIAAKRIADNYPGISIIGVMDGYRPRQELIDWVCRLSPEIVICGMGAPRQEAFLVALADAGWKGVGFTCGGYLDHLCKGFHYYPALVDRLNLRWLYRLAREPRRLVYRNVVEHGPFWAALAHGLLDRGLHKVAPPRWLKQ